MANEKIVNRENLKAFRQAYDTRLKNGELVVSKSLTAKDIENVSDESGTYQDNAFISQGTGTANNTAIVDTSDVAKQIEKQGNTVVVNQLIQNGNFASTSNWFKSNVSASFSVSNNTAHFTAYTKGDQLYHAFDYVANHKYLLCANIKLTTATTEVYIRATGVNRQGTVATTQKQNVCAIFSTNTSGSSTVAIYDNRDSGFDDIEISNYQCIDLTQMFNGDIPQDLLDNPSHFSWYYNGSLDYNTGALSNCNGRYLVCTGRNVWDEKWENGSYDTTTGEPTTAGVIRSKSTNYIRVIPNVTYYAKTNAKTMVILFYDINKNYINYVEKSDNTFTTPTNAYYIRFRMEASYGTTYNHDITISLYYTPEQGGEGYSEYYPYEESKVYDTGTETLLAFDKKTPDGTWYHNSGDNTNLGALEWTKENNHFYSEIINDLKIPTNSSTLPNLICPKYQKATANEVYGETKDKIIGVTTSGRFYVYDSTISDATALATALSNVPCQYELADASKTTEQGTPFAENIEINDYGMMYWLDTDNNLVGVPQGVKIFYPAWYAGYIDSLFARTDGDASEVVIQSELNEYVKQVDKSSNVVDNAGLTYLVKKAYLQGNVITLTIFAKNTTGSAIAENTKLFTLGSGMFIAGQYFPVIVDSPLKVYINSDDNGGCTLSGGNLNNNGTIKLIVSYAVA